MIWPQKSAKGTKTFEKMKGNHFLYQIETFLLPEPSRRLIFASFAPFHGHRSPLCGISYLL